MKSSDRTTLKLTEKESKIMTLLWDKGPMSVRTMLEYYDEPRPHFNTVSTIVRILEEKGYVAHETGGTAYKYYAVADKTDFRERSFSRLVKDYFNGSYKSAVSALVEEEKISADELREIIELIERKKDN